MCGARGDPFCVVFDCESDCSFAECAGGTRDDKLHNHMQFTTLCAAVVPSQPVLERAGWDAIKQATTRRTFWRDEAAAGGTPLDELLALFDRAEVIVCFNGLGFDFPLIRRFYRPAGGLSAPQRYVRHRSKALDIMARARDACNLYFKLDLLLAQNGLATKTGDGLKAVKLWRENKREELAAYCYMDVELTLRLALVDGMQTPAGVCMDACVNSLEYAIKARRAHPGKRARESE